MAGLQISVNSGRTTQNKRKNYFGWIVRELNCWTYDEPCSLYR